MVFILRPDEIRTPDWGPTVVSLYSVTEMELPLKFLSPLTSDTEKVEGALALTS